MPFNRPRTTDASLVTSDITTNNASTTKHGFLKKLDNTATNFMNGQGDWAAPGVSSAGLQSGTSFPGSPSTNDLFHRTDHNLVYYYDGTRWLSLNLYVLHTVKIVDNLAPATTEVCRWTAPVRPVGTDAWLISQGATYLVSGGSALSGSHKWTITMIKYPSTGAVTGTKVIDSGASGAWRSDTPVAIGELLGSNYMIVANAAATGTPGSLYYYAVLYYRIVAT